MTWLTVGRDRYDSLVRLIWQSHRLSISGVIKKTSNINELPVKRRLEWFLLRQIDAVLDT